MTKSIIDAIKLPHIVTWHDSEPTNACGWLVIDSLHNNVASGGLFMHPNASLEEVRGLAKSMSWKNGLQDPPIGGAKGGIRFDHKHPDANNVLKRFLIAHREYIFNIWSTGADLNTDNQTIHRIINQDLNLPSGFVSVSRMLNNFYSVENNPDSFLIYIGQPIAKYFTLGEYATGYSVAMCIEKLCPRGARVAIQGWGTVGRSLGYVLHERKLGEVVSIIEKDYFIYHEDGLDIDNLLAVRQNLMQKNQFSTDNYLTEIEKAGYFLTRRDSLQNDEDFLADCLSAIEINIFCPCATRYVVTDRIVCVLANCAFKNNSSQNSWLISGANNVFTTQATISELNKRGIVVLPEWVANSGNALLYNELHKPRKETGLLFDECISFINQRIEHFLKMAGDIAKMNNISLYEACYIAISNVLEKVTTHKSDT
ncbi:MAG: protein belonging to Glu/Leu/Phe/Val dehydrogenase family [Gammaproteobacteria bacterium]|jgi:glutamate dehydrogenase (NAD(P)+)|nr:protein belonging to Glu/Leu/Phe/Val dehydrogenase family [Gammaproteobacteria bacterium]